MSQMSAIDFWRVVLGRIEEVGLLNVGIDIEGFTASTGFLIMDFPV